MLYELRSIGKAENPVLRLFLQKGSFKIIFLNFSSIPESKSRLSNSILPELNDFDVTKHQHNNFPSKKVIMIQLNNSLLAF